MGSGSIPLERARMGPYKMIFASDKSVDLVSAFKTRLREKPFERKKKTIFPKCLDAGDLSRFESSLFSVIVTDPPWGDWERIGETELVDLYVAFLKEAKRTLSPEGRLVLLVGRSDSIEKALAASGFDGNIEEDLNVLISGKKARAMRLTR